METDLFLIRHGETEWNRILKYQGQTDIDLNETGFNQARLLSERLKDREIDRIYTSDLKRAANTAGIVAKPHRLELKKEERLREICFGEWEGMNYEEINKDYPELYKRWRTNPTSVRPPSGETFVEFQKRVTAIMERITDLHKGEKVAVVAHGGTIRVYLAYLLEMPLIENRKLLIHNTSFSHIKFYDNRMVLKLLNSIYHLD